MNYDKLQRISREEAAKIAFPDEKIDSNILALMPKNPDVIVYGVTANLGDEELVEFILKYVNPKNSTDIFNFLRIIVRRIYTDVFLSSNAMKQQLSPDYIMLYDQYRGLFRHPDSMSVWCESKSIYLWNEYLLPKKRAENFDKIKKEQDFEKMDEISKKIKDIYNFSDAEIKFLQYFCSQAKTDTLDASCNTFLYLWSKKQGTGKTTVAEYICSFLNGENGKNAEDHKSKMKKELQIERFSYPKSINSRCTFIDESSTDNLKKYYDDLKSSITSNSCEVEYKYRNMRLTKRCFRNYLITSNDSPEYFINAESERRVLPIHFLDPKQIDFEQLKKLWYTFVLECNLPDADLMNIYYNFIKPNAQKGDIGYLSLELEDIITPERINAVVGTSYFSVSNIMTFDEIRKQNITRQLIKEVLNKLYGEPDKSQRYYKANRKFFNSENEKKEDLPF